MESRTKDLVRSGLRGVVDIEERDAGLMPLRLPRSARAQMDSPWMRFAAEQASGVRLEVDTASTWIEVEVETVGLVLPWMPDEERPAVFSWTVGDQRVADVRVVGGAELHLMAPGGPRVIAGESAVIRHELGGDGSVVRRVVLWFAQTHAVTVRDVRSDRPLIPAGAGERPTWWHHGSSISHCIEAETPLGVWPVLAAKALDLDVTNLGFAANAHLDPFTARAMRDSGADLLSLKMGINIVGGDSMKRRTFIPALHGFLDTLREGAPHTPILLISPIFCPMHEDVPGPTVTDPVTGQRRGRHVEEPDPLAVPLTLRMIREIFREVIAARREDDGAIFLLDGLDLFGEADIAELPDGLHPSPTGYRRMAERFAASPVVSQWMGARGSLGSATASPGSVSA